MGEGECVGKIVGKNLGGNGQKNHTHGGRSVET